MKDLEILIKDCNGYWSPLQNQYWSQSSSELISKHPQFIVEEIISFYCPQCLTRYPEDETLGYLKGKCPSCFQCPICNCVMSKISKRDFTESMICRNCLFKAGSIRNDEIKLKESNNFQELLKHFKSDFSNNRKTFLMNKSNNFEVHQPIWQLSDLEKKMKDQTIFSSLKVDPMIKTQTILNEKTANSTNKTNITEISDKRDDPNLMLNGLAPQNVKLFTKCTLRSRKDLETGKMNILIQPKVFPLEGDSSMKVQKGKWWVKDSSAIHMLPMISVVKLPEEEKFMQGDFTFFDILITNNLEKPVVIQVVKYEDLNNIDNQLIIVNDLGTKLIEKSDLSEVLTSQNLSDMDNNELYIHLDGYEDEVLKDSYRLLGSRSASKSEDNFQSNISAFPEVSSQMIWKVDQKSNIAKLIIPVKKNESSFSTKYYSLDLFFKVQLNEEKKYEYPVKILFNY